MSKFVKFFNRLSIKDVPMVGGKNASLGEMYQKLSKQGINVPNGFATTSAAYDFFMEESGLRDKIRKILEGLDTHDMADLSKKGKKVRQTILNTPLPDKLHTDVLAAYKKLSKSYKTKNLSVAVRSSATAEDLPDASFAGQQETYLNVSGEENLMEAVHKCIASLFTNRAISYREDKGFDHFDVALSVGIQKMVRADKASSGVMFTIDTESGFENAVLINSIYGLGENIVQGKVTPDEFYVFKPTEAIISKRVAEKDIKMVYDNTAKKSPVKNIKVPKSKMKKQSITDEQALQLAKWGMEIENHYERPMDIEWALDGEDKKLYIVQARPETIHSVRDYNVLREYILKKKSKVLVTGSSVGSKIGAGEVNKILNAKSIGKFKKGQVLVTEMTDPDWEPIMKIASAIVTDKGGRTCHAAIVSRELGIPCIVGTENASKTLKSKDKVTVSCAEGEEGKVYKGKLKFEVKETDIGTLKRPKTKIMMIMGTPEMAFDYSFIPNDGVGLAREEFIINNHIQIHPLALINYHKLKDKKAKKKITELTYGYKDKKEFFVDKLAQGIAMIAASVYPKDIIVRLSDFKSNEYANLIGGPEFEPDESNPMLGWRGASRYYDPKYKQAFELECKAFKKVREEMGLVNMKVMIPICRTVEEGKKVMEIMAKHGLERGKDGLEVYVMAELPTNMILADDYAEIFDGFSIGSNDLTQFTLGIDRDAGYLEVAGVSNENNESVKTLAKYLIQAAHRKKRPVGICGQAPSDFPEFARFLVDCGIDSISLNPDTVIKATMDLAEYESKKKKKKPKKTAKKSKSKAKKTTKRKKATKKR